MLSLPFGAVWIISIHALLAESDYRDCVRGLIWRISIHALLAESDAAVLGTVPDVAHFYPRSPCGERLTLIWDVIAVMTISIHALLAESDLIYCHLLRTSYSNFYPRSPCGERLGILQKRCHELLISIHALLAESDKSSYQLQP